ncbi:hypothetical protein Vafri_17642 [Volvox africanus]|uniref:Uncharacterized protein n=1 Tax=Volvox africanus TaxID=51714 RepID=A0A8J4F6V0_9CHLO|nr:hypothetical protein Vafri_17642 [Volvox africanus]
MVLDFVPIDEACVARPAPLAAARTAAGSDTTGLAVTPSGLVVLEVPQAALPSAAAARASGASALASKVPIGGSRPLYDMCRNPPFRLSTSPRHRSAINTDQNLPHNDMWKNCNAALTPFAVDPTKPRNGYAVL